MIIKNWTEKYLFMTMQNKIQPSFSWQDIDTVLLDMDGTLLDKHFDDYFWEQYVPEHYSLLHNITVDEAKNQLLKRYKSVENTLAWTDLDHWSRVLGLDIPNLKIRVEHLIATHPYVLEFLKFVKDMGKQLYLVTNAHPKALAIKLRKTTIGPWFKGIVCSDEIGLAKEDPDFWKKLEKKLLFSVERTLLADDTEKVLSSARDYGMQHLVYVAKPSSKKPVKYSNLFPSIQYFSELIPS